MSESRASAAPPPPEEAPESGAPSEESAPPSREDSFFGLLKQVAEAPRIAPASAEAQASLVGQRLSHFKVVERLGAGGMGVVYRGEDSRLRRSVALKVLPPLHANDRSRQQRLFREARNAAAVSHPNIAAIYEVGEQDGVSFIAMEYLEGETLRSRLQGPPRPPEEVLRWCLQVAQGLARAHLANIVHRDLKPDNVMLCKDGLIKILDFGLAKPQAGPAPAPAPAEPAAPPLEKAGEETSQESGTFDGKVVGTPRYMSPEQSRGHAVDARSDIYSFGVMLVELCLGYQAGQDPRAELLRHLPLAAHGPEGVLRRSLLRVAERCLEPEPDQRFVDGTALLAALQQVARERESQSLTAVPVVAPPRGGLSRTAVTLALLALLAALVAGVWMLRPGRAGEGKLTVRRLTANPPENAIADAALSPDGKTLAYVDRRGLWLRRMEPVRTDPVKLPERFTPQSVTWFPKGDEMLVVGLSPGVEGSSAWVIGTNGKARLLSQQTLSTPRVSPDGARLAWITPEGISVGQVAADTGKVLVKLERQKRLDRGFDALAWSPDGKRLAYLRQSVGADGAEAVLETVDAATGKVTALVSDPRLVLEDGHGALAWAPDGRLFYVLAERPPHESGATLWAVMPDPSTGDAPEPPRALHGWTGAFPTDLTVSASGALSYVLSESQVDVYVAALEEGGRRMATPQRTTLTDHNELPSAWTEDGQGVLFTSDQDGSHDVYTQDARTGETRSVAAGPDSQTWPELAPSGKAVLYWNVPLADDDQPRLAELMRVPFEGGAPVRVLTTQHAAREGTGLPPSQAHFRCPAHGRMCVLGEIDGGELVLTSFDPYTGHGGTLPPQEAPAEAHGWDISPAGDKVALPRGGYIRTVDLVNHRIQDRIVNLSCELQFVTFTADGAGLFATGICPGERPYQVFFVDPSKPPKVLWDSSYAWVGHPTASPDGKSLALAVKPFDNDVWLLTGL